MKVKTLVIGLSLIALLGSGIALAASDKKNEVKKGFHPLLVHQQIDKSKEGLLKYKKENEVKLNKLENELETQEKVYVTITFTKPLNDVQVNKLVADYGLVPEKFIVRTIEKGTGLRGTALVSPIQNGQIDNKMLNDMVARNEATIKGIIEVVASVPSGHLKALASDKFVFLVDPSSDSHLVDNPNKKYMPGVSWSLEDNNMVVD